jgi:hypothetical protein
MGLWSWAFGVDAENAARAEQADATLARLNREKFDSGDWSAEQYQAVETRRLAAVFNPDQEIQQSFEAGWNEGLANEKALIKDTINGVGGFVWGSIPWWVYIVGAVALFLWMGGATLLKGRLAR